MIDIMRAFGHFSQRWHSKNGRAYPSIPGAEEVLNMLDEAGLNRK